MPTIAEACSLLGVSRPTLKKFLVRLKIEPEPHPLDQRVLLLSDKQLQTLREVLDQRPVKHQNRPPNAPGWPRVPLASASPVEVSSPARPPVDRYSASQRHPAALSASQEDLARRPLPAGWIARSSFCKRHGLNDRSVIRQASMPIAASAPDGQPWGSYTPTAHIYQAVYAAYREDQIAECVQVARVLWAHRWHRCEDPTCPCQG